MKTRILGCFALFVAAAPAGAKWTMMPASRVTIAGTGLTVQPTAGWNKWSVKPVKKEEFWSFDGPLLNRLELFGGIASGEALAHEANKKREPLPKFAATMHASDVAELIERTVRITDNAPDFVTEVVEPASFAGRAGFRVRYHYTVAELVRRGEARGSIVGGKLYLINFSAPALYYFDHVLPGVETIMGSARID